MNRKLIKIIGVLFVLTICSYLLRIFSFKQQSVEKNKDIYINIEGYEEKIYLEDYIIGVVAGEMPALFQDEALKAQAVASRTYAINMLKNNSKLTGTIADQVYLDKQAMKEKWQDKYDEYYNKIKRLVYETKGEIVTYNNEPIKAYYFSMTNGYTESSINVFNEEYDYLNVVASEWDSNNSYSMKYSKLEFCNFLNINCLNIEINNIIRDESGRVKSININNILFTGLDIRKKLNLRSTDFEITFDDEFVTIITKGYGHGVGMSQYGANEMAKSGKNYKEILKYYYQNTEISNL